MKFLTIPVADGDNLSNARIHTSETLEGLQNGTNYICYQLSESSVSFAPGAVNAGLGSGQSVNVAIGEDAYELIVPEGTSTIMINGTAYDFNTADIIGKAPLILSVPTVTGEPVAGETISYAPAPCLYDPAGGVPQTLLRTVRNGIVLQTGNSYTVDGFDPLGGISLRQETVNAYGVTTAETEVLSPPTYAPTPLVLSGARALLKSDGVQSGGATSLLAVMTYRLDVNDGTLFHMGDPSGTEHLIFYFGEKNSDGRTFVRDANGGLIINYEKWITKSQMPGTTDKLCLLIYVQNTYYTRYALYRNGTLLQSFKRSGSVTGKMVSSAKPLAIGARNTIYSSGNVGNYLKGDCFDMRIWADVSGTVDITTEAVARNFIDAEGAPRHPDVANYLYGTPKIWMPLDPAQANALVNLGSAGNFTSKKGTFA